MQPNDVVKGVERGFKVVGLFNPSAVVEKRHLFAGSGVGVVVADVLRCSTTLQAVLACGARGIVIHAKPSGASASLTEKTYEAVFPGVPLVLAGEQHGRAM